MSQKEIDDWMTWRDAERAKHRFMTAGEYWAWCRGGDAISHPSSANAFPGGLTIDFSAPTIIGRASAIIPQDGRET